jgi:DNA-binding response OmpR family regulator
VSTASIAPARRVNNPADAAARKVVAFARPRLHGARVVVAGVGTAVTDLLTSTGAQVLHGLTPADVLREATGASVVLVDASVACGPGGLLARMSAAGISVPCVVIADHSRLVDCYAAGATAVAPTGVPAAIVTTTAAHARRGRSHGLTLAAQDVEVTVDTVALDAWVQGSAVGLTRLEFDVLTTLARRAGAVCSAAVLSSACWADGSASPAAVTEVVRRLRTKLATSGAQAVVRTHRGSGWSVRSAA